MRAWISGISETGVACCISSSETFLILAHSQLLKVNDYSLIDAALDGVRNYMKALDAEPNQLKIYLSPTLNEDGDPVEMGYTAEMTGDKSEIELNHSFSTEQNFTGLDAFEELDYLEWIERFTTEFPEVDLHYFSSPKESSMIENSVGKIEDFLNVFRESQQNISILMDPKYVEEDQRWSIEYSIRANIGEEKTTSSMDISIPFEGENEDFGAIYPLVVNRIKEDYPEAELFYPDPEEI